MATKPVPEKLNPGHDAAVRRMLAHDALGQPSSIANGAAEENHEYASPKEPRQELRSDGDRASSSPRQNPKR